MYIRRRQQVTEDNKPQGPNAYTWASDIEVVFIRSERVDEVTMSVSHFLPFHLIFGRRHRKGSIHCLGSVCRSFFPLSHVSVVKVRHVSNGRSDDAFTQVSRLVRGTNGAGEGRLLTDGHDNVDYRGFVVFRRRCEDPCRRDTPEVHQRVHCSRCHSARVEGSDTKGLP